MAPYRHIVINGEDLDFTNGFADLHTLSYSRIFSGSGFSIDDAKDSIDTLEAIRHADVIGLTGDYHPFLKVVRG